MTATRAARVAALFLGLWLFSAANAARALEGYLVAVTANPGQIMDGAKVLARVPRGTRLWVLEEKAGWLNVNDPKSDQRGWISERAVQEVTFTAAQEKLLEQSAKHYEDFEQQSNNEQFAAARKNLEATLRLERQVYGAHPEMAVTLGDMCVLLGKLGEHAAARSPCWKRIRPRLLSVSAVL
jgi:type IV secretory pathway VirB10-like protein